MMRILKVETRFRDGLAHCSVLLVWRMEFGNKLTSWMMSRNRRKSHKKKNSFRVRPWEIDGHCPIFLRTRRGRVGSRQIRLSNYNRILLFSNGWWHSTQNMFSLSSSFPPTKTNGIIELGLFQILPVVSCGEIETNDGRTKPPSAGMPPCLVWCVCVF